MDSSNDTDTGDTQTMSSQSTIPNITPRIALVNTAVSFLQNPNVARSSIVHKENFLRSKGLTEEEIKLAFQQTGVFTKDPNSGAIINMEIGHRPSTAPNTSLSPPYRTPESAIQKFYNIINSTAMVTGIVYAIYYVYKRFIGPFLFGGKKDKKSTADLLNVLDQKVDRNFRKLNVEMTAIKDEIRTTYDGDHMMRQNMLTFKSDLDAIKGLLLNRKQFASPVVPPSIPAWQLQSQRIESHNDGDKNDDNRSGGSSSETEVVTKHSDSSLEMIS